MARKYSGKHGKHGSKKPSKIVKHSWMTYTTKEVEQLILKLAKAGSTASKIGLILRDAYGIPDVKSVTNKRINKILEANNIIPELPEDLMALIRREILLLKHMEKNKHDMTAKRGLHLTESKINKLSKYYKDIGRLDKNWKYDRDRIKLIVT
ncbi:30S ribosomal protein S15 [Candidatus Woesearchaeota archaeon]|nr:30S ribosomal protein S15 [Candidatus Woesearchaeota archaeon]